MNNKHKEKAIEILKNNLYLTISTSTKTGKPWIANLYYTHDKQYNFYWYSPKDSVHSTNIRNNNKVALSIFDSNAVGDDVDAVYIEAVAHEVSDKKELIKGLTLYASKMVKTKFTNKTSAKRFIKQYGDFTGLSKLRMYKAVPIKVYKLAPSEMFNEKFIDSRIEVNLK